MLLLGQYLEDTRFTIPADHDAPNCILSLADYTGILSRWLLWLSKMVFDVVYHTGIKHQAVNGLPQLPTILKSLHYALLLVSSYVRQHRT